MKYSIDLIEELIVLSMFDLANHQAGLKIHHSAEPIISLGAVNTTYGLVTESGVKSFTEFTSNFKGYLVMPDPDNVQRDTTSLLIFGKIGSDW